jgi:signal transduction histidine kinase
MDAAEDTRPPEFMPRYEGGPRASQEHESLRRQLAERTRERDESEARFRALVEGNGDGIVVVDPGGEIRYANRAAAHLFGISRDRLIGTPFGHPLVAEETTELEVLPRGAGPVVVEMRVVGAEWEGEPAWIACLRDITDRKQAEESALRVARAEALGTAARDSSRRFRFLAEASSTLASSLQQGTTLATLARLCLAELADWAIVYIDAGDGIGTRLEMEHCDAQQTIEAHRLRDLVLQAGADDPLVEALRTAELHTGRRSDVEMAGMLADPARGPLLEKLGLATYLMVPIVSRERRLGALALVRADAGRPYAEADIALAQALAGRAGLAIDNAVLYQSARAADRAKTDLIAVISHDLRTPLNSIIGYAELLELGLHDSLGPQSRAWVDRIRKSAEHQVHLINQLLIFSRIEAGGVELNPTEVELGALLEDVRGMVEPLAGRAGLALSTEVGDEVRTRTDADALHQIVLNLATNAVRYTESGEVRLAASAAGDDVIVRVEDTGIGIAPEHLDRIFEPFWQVGGSGRGGTGLGLSIVRRLARSLGGEVEVESTVGRGSTFTLRLPRQLAS